VPSQLEQADAAVASSTLSQAGLVTSGFVQIRILRHAPWLALAFAFAATLLLELALVERKYGVFGGGFGSSHVLDGAGEVGLFLLSLLLSQALLIGGLFLLMRALHGRRRDTPLFLLNFLFVGVAASAALLAVKYEVLSYFSDAIGFELIRNLGGGSIGDALLFVMDDAGLLAGAAAGAALTWWICWRLVRRFAPAGVGGGSLRWRHLLVAALALPFAACAADRVPDARYALSRFNAFAIANNALAALTDFDRDGYSWFSAQVDAHPFDGTRHPYALDIPNNGIDEDGLAGDFRFAGAPAAVAAPKLPERPKHLVLVVLESVRGDAIGKMVDGQPVTPVLNRLAREGTMVREAYSHVGFTTASLKSLFSGRLDPKPGGPSLFRDLKANGYRIGVISGQPESFGDISETVGMKASADVFVDAETLKEERAFSFAAKGSLLIDGRKLLREYDRAFGPAEGWRRPTFLYMNIQEAHFPYSHPETMRLIKGDPIPRGKIDAANRAWVERTYWNSVAYSDWLVGQLIERLKRAGVWEDTLLVVTADHGESLFDDDFLGHGHIIIRQQTHTDYRPMLLRALGAQGVPEGKGGAVFQHIGGLDWPTSIGMVERGGVWTVMDIETEQVRFSDTGRSGRYSDLAPGERARADRLATEWARQRWLAHSGR
jgi:phosphoglycerol transferase MdoB-like AlkP superfamily enzyme